MDVRVLGPFQVHGRPGVLPLGGTKLCAVFAMLALQCNHVVSVDELLAGLWAGDGPARAANALQVYVSRLRKALRDESDIALLSRRPGYVLQIDAERVDVHRFGRLTREGLGAMPGAPQVGVARLTAALELWQGSPLAEFADEPFAAAEIVRLQERRLEVLSSLIDAQLSLGRHIELIGRLEDLVAENPFHEGLHGQLILGLYRCGRQSEALQAFQRLRRVFADELGIDPGKRLQDLERAILAQDPELLVDQQGVVRRDGDRWPSAHPGRIHAMPPRNPHFTGRAEELSKLFSELSSSSGTPAVQSIYGMGGVGKTELAVEFTHRFGDEYDIIWWLDAEQPVLIPEQLCRLAGRLGLPANGTTSDTVDRLHADLAARSRWLLVFDNAERPEDIAHYRPGGAGHMLVTSRSPRWGAIGGRVELDVLDRAETVALLQRRSPLLDNHLAHELADELGDLPLATAQAAAYLEQTGLAPVDFLRRFRSHRSALLAKGEVLNYHGRVDTTWLLALRQLRELHPDSVALLHIAAFLAPEPIPYSLFTQHAQMFDEPLRTTAAGGDDAVADAVGTVVGYSLVHRYSNGFQLHRLVQEVIRHQLSEPTKQAVVDQVVALLAAIDPGEPNDPRSWPAYAALTPHILAAGRLGDREAAARRLMLGVADYLTVRGDTRAGKRIAEDLHRRWTEVLGADHPDTLRAAANLTSALAWLAEHRQARSMSQDTLTRATIVLGPDDPVTLRVATNLSFALTWLGEGERACTLGERALDHATRAFGRDHVITLRLAANHVFALTSHSRPREARRFGAETVERCRRVVGFDHPITLVAVAHLALAHTWLGQPPEALELAEDVHQRSRRALGNDHPITLAAGVHLTFLKINACDPSPATVLGRMTLDRGRAALGPDHLITISAAAVLALALAAAGDPGPAHELSRSTMEQARRSLGPGHLITLIAATALANALIARAEDETARAVAAAALEHARVRLTPEHPIVIALAAATALARADQT